MKLNLTAMLMVFLPFSIFGQIEINATLSGGIEEDIKVHMLPFYGYESDWKVSVKEVTPSNDTVEFHGRAFCTITRDSVQFKKDSAEIVFRFKWNSQETREVMDMRSIRIWYSWDAGKYFVNIEHEPKISPDNPQVQLLISSSCSPKLDVDHRELLYLKSLDDSQNRIMLNEWKLGDDRIALLHREVIRHTEKFRTRKFLFTR